MHRNHRLRIGFSTGSQRNSGTALPSASRRLPLRRFVVVEDSMLPALHPGDGLIGLRGGAPRSGQLRVFPDPRRGDGPELWLVKRVGEVRDGCFEARSDNADAPGVVDSRIFGWVDGATSYRVIWVVRNRPRAL